MLKGHVILWLKTNTCTEDVGQSTSLLSKSVDNWCSRWGQRSLEHIAEDAENTVEVLEVLGGSTVVGVSLPLDTSHHLGNDDEINDQWRSKERVLTDIEETRNVLALT